VDRLFSPWRYQYVTRPDTSQTGGADCLFCRKAEERNDEDNRVLHRGVHNYVLLNLYPYTTGHLMIAPYAHVASLLDCAPEALQELVLLARRAEANLREAYRCEGLNMGFNIGSCAGAGVAGHLHFHVLPRWSGDANFMTSVGETRVIPEDLAVTWQKLVQQSWAIS
jgi:ATP adenylyltransferase